MIDHLLKLRTEAELLPKIKGRASCITAIRKRIRFYNMYKMSDREAELFIKESRGEIDALKKATGAK